MMSMITPAYPEEVVDDVFYPSSDGEPLGETGLHVDAIFCLFEVFRDHYRPRTDVAVMADQFWYWERGNPSACTAPDIMIVFGARYQEMPRDTYKLWEEGGVVPAVIFEVVSASTWQRRLTQNRDDYERLGVAEYFLFDPQARYIPESLMGFRLQEGRYQELHLSEDRSLFSQQLAVNLRAQGHFLRAFDAVTGEMLLTGFESAYQERRLREEAERAKEEEARAKKDAVRAKEVAERLKEEAERAKEEALREAETLRKQLQKLLDKQQPPTENG